MGCAPSRSPSIEWGGGIWEKVTHTSTNFSHFHQQVWIDSGLKNVVCSLPEEIEAFSDSSQPITEDIVSHACFWQFHWYILSEWPALLVRANERKELPFIEVSSVISCDVLFLCHNLIKNYTFDVFAVFSGVFWCFKFIHANLFLLLRS